MSCSCVLGNLCNLHDPAGIINLMCRRGSGFELGKGCENPMNCQRLFLSYFEAWQWGLYQLWDWNLWWWLIWILQGESNDHISLGMFWWGVFFCKVTRKIYYPYQSRLVAGQLVNLTMPILLLPKKEFLILWSSEFLTFAVTWPLIKRNAIMWSIPLPCVQCSLQWFMGNDWNFLPF
jgi:hypothetical protein